MKTLAFAVTLVLGLLLGGNAYAVCPSTATDCPSPTYKQVTVGAATGGAQGAGSVNAQSFWINGSAFTPYTLPQATTSVLGGVMCDGSTITCTNGVIRAIGGGGSPGGSNGQIQFNNSSAFGGVAGLTFDGTSVLSLGQSGTSVGALRLFNLASGSIIVQPTSGALGTITITIPASSGTMTVLGNTVTGSGGTLVEATSPTLVTPNLGTPSSLTLTNATGLTTAGLNAAAVTYAKIQNGASNGLLGVNSGSAPTEVSIGSGLSLSAGTLSATGGGSSAFSALTSGTNTTAAMLVGTGASLAATGSGSITATAIPVGGITGLGTGIAAALAVNVGTAGAPVILNGAGGTPSSITLTNATGYPVATSGAFGIVKPDNSTITVSGGVITAIGGSATSIVPGTTTVGGCTAPALIENSTGTVMACPPVGTGVIAALGVNVGSAGAFVVNGGALGTPSSGTLTNATGLPIAGITGLGTGVATALANAVDASAGFGTVGTSGATVGLLNGNNAYSGTATFSGAFAHTATSLPTQAGGTLGIAGTAAAPTLGASAEGDIFLTSTGGLNVIGQGSTNDLTVLNKTGGSVCTVATGTTNWNCTGLQVGGTSVLVSGGALGTPSSGTLTNATGLPISTGVSGLATGVATFLGTPSSANLAAAVTGETGTGALVFGTSPTLTTPALGTPSAVVLTNATGTAASLTAGAANGLDSATTTVVVNGATAPTSGQVLTATSSTAANWQTPSASATSITPGTTTVSGATAPCLIDNSTGTTMGCAALSGNFSISGGTLAAIVPDTTHTTSATVANAGGQDNFNGSSLTATGLASPAANSSQLITNQNASALTIANNSVTVGGLPLSTTLHSYGFYGYTYNSTTTQWDAYGFPGFGTITTNALTKFIDGTGATTASSITDAGSGVTVGSPTGGAEGAGTINATNLYVNGVAVGTGGSSAFSSITTGTNTTATMTVGAGGSLTFASTGVVNANQLGGVGLLGGTLTNTDFCTYASSGTLLNCNTGSTGSGNVVLATSPTLVTPALGTPSAVVLTNATGTAASLTAGTATAANGLNSATTTVAVSSATAPTSGQVLTATSGTAATWQTPTASASSITPGTTTIVGATAPCIIQNSTSTTMACSSAASTLLTVADTTHTTSATTANLGGQDDYNGSSITATLATLASGQTAFVTNQNASTLTISNNSQTVSGLPLSTSLHTGGFYGYAFNTTTSQVSAYGFPGFGTITSGALMSFADGTGAATAFSAGTGVLTALGVNTGSAGAFVVNGGALGTPSSGTATNLTGTASGLTAGTATAANGLNSATTTVVVNGATAPTSGQVLTATSSTAASWQSPSGGSAFSAITGSTNTTAAMVVGTGASLGVSGSGTITATAAPISGLTGAGTGVLTALAAAANGTGGFGTVGTSGTNVGLLNAANTWSGVQTITNSDWALLGSSTGKTTFTSANAGASNFTITVPAVTDTLATLGTADQTLSGGFNLTAFSIGTVATGTTTIDCGKNPGQWMVDAGASTLAAPTSDGSCNVKVINGSGAGTITFSGFREGTNTGDTIPTADRSTATATFTNASAVIGWTNTLQANDPVYFTNSGGALPTNFTAGTVYYVSSTGLSGTQVEVSATPGGSVITAGSAGTGTQTGHAASSYTLSISRINGMSKYLASADQ